MKNRQMIELKTIGKNKAVHYEEKIKAVNSSSEVEVLSTGLDRNNMDAFLENIDFLFDAVDVTTTSGMEAKLLLHEKAAEKRLPVGSALDLAYCQCFPVYLIAPDTVF